MTDDRDTYLNKEEVGAKHLLIRNHIDESQETYLHQCQHAENLVWDALGPAPAMRDLLLQHVDLIRQRHNELYDFFDQFFLPTLQHYTDTLSEVDSTTGARLRHIGTDTP
jgi:hypothetical protein